MKLKRAGHRQAFLPAIPPPYAGASLKPHGEGAIPLLLNPIPPPYAGASLKHLSAAEGSTAVALNSPALRGGLIEAFPKTFQTT